mmetsp:Transcript_19221/g.48818  ORF Transcript_19221/g.48818 Transcript_19221/m.48818 type:complete len:667 (-) Transcript_19221:164-2164(-)
MPEGRWEVKMVGRWCPVDPDYSRELDLAEMQGKLEFAYQTRGIEYMVDLSRMLQTNRTTGRRNQLRRVLPDGKAVDGWSSTQMRLAAVQTRTLGGSTQQYASGQMSGGHGRFQVWLNGGWKKMPIGEEQQIAVAVDGGKTDFIVEARGHRYRINMNTSTQENLATHKLRSIRQVELQNLAVPVAPAAPQIGRLASVPEGSVAVEQKCTTPFKLSYKAHDQNHDNQLSIAELEQIWFDAACKQALDDAEETRDLIRETVTLVFQEMDLLANGIVFETAWTHYWLLERYAPSFYACQVVQDGLRQVIQKDKSILSRLLRLFEEADDDNDAEITAEEMARVCRRVASSASGVGGFEVKGSLAYLSRQGEHADDDLSYNYFDFVAELLGRERHEVKLFQYDISGGRAWWSAPLLLGQQMDGLWHTGIVVYDKEYWYGGKLFESTPGMTPFGVPVKEIVLGHTVVTQDELWDFLVTELAREFTVETYDVLTHNCNCFTDEVTQFLLAQHIPDEVRLQPEKVMDSMAARAFRPVLNRWLGGFNVDGMDKARATDKQAAEELWSCVDAGSLVTFSRMDGGRPVAAEVLYKEDGICELRYWEPNVCGDIGGQLVEGRGIPKTQIKPLHRRTKRSKPRRAVNVVPDQDVAHPKLLDSAPGSCSVFGFNLFGLQVF